MTIITRGRSTVYPKKYARGFVLLCFVVAMQSFIMNSHEVVIHIHQGCFAGTGAIVRLPQCQWCKPEGYGKISQCITTTKHSNAKTVCIFLGIYCISWYPSETQSKLKSREILLAHHLFLKCPIFWNFRMRTTVILPCSVKFRNDCSKSFDLLQSFRNLLLPGAILRDLCPLISFSSAIVLISTAIFRAQFESDWEPLNMLLVNGISCATYSYWGQNCLKHAQ